MRRYTTRDVAALLGLTVRQAQEYGRSGILDPDRDEAGHYLFSFQDLVLLRTAKGLLDARVPQRRILRSLRRLRDQLPTGRSLTELRISADGDDVVVTDNGRSWEPESGQLRFSFDVAELASRVRPLDRERAAPGGGANAADVADGSESDPAREAREPGEVGVESAREWLELGMDLETRAPAQAQRAYRKALELEPGQPDALVNLGRLLQEEGAVEEAVSLYARALESSGGDHPTAAFNLGIALEDLGRDQDAVEAYRKALTADPSFADAHYNLSRVLERQGDKVSALRHLKSYRSLTRIGG